MNQTSKCKIKLYAEIVYLLALITLAIGVALMTKADFGLSMVVAPAYILHLKISQFLPFFSFGMAEYVFQAILLLLLIPIVRRFRISYLFSFATALFYGGLLDVAMLFTEQIPANHLAVHLILYVVGLFLTALGVCLMFRTYVSPEVYELVVKEIAQTYKLNVNRCKTVYDLLSCTLSILLSFLFFGWLQFEGIRWGTIFCAAVNGFLIGGIGKLLDRYFTYPRLLFREKKPGSDSE